MTKFLFLLLVAVGCAGAQLSFAAQPNHGKPFPWSLTCERTMGHADGDTFACAPPADTGGAFIVRLAGIDAPEKTQAHWTRSRDLLRSLTLARTSVSCYKYDQYGRLVCRVMSPDGRKVADEMLAAGRAWHAVKYVAEQTPAERVHFARLEGQARAARLGLFVEPNPQPPWECRQAKRMGQPCR